MTSEIRSRSTDIKPPDTVVVVIVTTKIPQYYAVIVEGI
jgi:hypothetical protein